MFSHLLYNNLQCLRRQCTIVALKIATGVTFEQNVSITKESSAGSNLHCMHA
jgi:hypothetical protein